MNTIELHKEILVEVLSRQNLKITFENLKIKNSNEIVEQTSYRTIKRIKKVLDNDKLDDFECIERIIRLLEDIGVYSLSRHDF